MTVSVFDFFCECGGFTSPNKEEAGEHVRLNHMRPHDLLSDRVAQKIYAGGSDDDRERAHRQQQQAD